MTNISYSKSSNLAASVQKRRTLYLAESDPRANKEFITKYMNDYYAEVVVMSNEKYLAMLSAQINVGTDTQEEYDAVPADTALNAPTGLYWNYGDSSATKFVTVNGSNYVNLKVTFDPGNSLPDSLEYEYYFETTTTGASAGSTSKTTKAPIDKSKIIVNSNTSGIISASWAGISDAIAYTVTVTGTNLPPREFHQKSASGNIGNAKKRSYYLNYDPSHPSTNYNSPGYRSLASNGRTFFKIVPASGSFSGSYVVTFVAHYTTGTSSSAKATFSINGGVTIV